LSEKFGFVLENEPISEGVLRLTEDIFQVLDCFLGAGISMLIGVDATKSDRRQACSTRNTWGDDCDEQRSLVAGRVWG
jgi:hypothetical protein